MVANQREEGGEAIERPGGRTSGHDSQPERRRAVEPSGGPEGKRAGMGAIQREGGRWSHREARGGGIWRGSRPE